MTSRLLTDQSQARELALAVEHVRRVSSDDHDVDEFRARMLAFAADHPDALHRSCLSGHFTASAVVFDRGGERVLLMHHTKLRRWLQPGGHVDGEGDLAKAALREVQEETGIANLELIEPAVDLDIHTIGARGDEPEHDHLDVRFAARAPERAEWNPNHESTDLRWFTHDEVASLGVDPGLMRLIGLLRTIDAGRRMGT